MTNATPTTRPTQMPAADTWHLFEVHLVTHHTRQGKRYKDWLFARIRNSPDDPVDIIRSGATLLMRDVVREHLRREFAPPHVVSIHTPLGNQGEGSLTLEDLLPSTPDPLDGVAQRECERLARTHADEAFAQTRHDERVAMAARTLGLALSHPVVENAAGCRKSRLYDAYRAMVQRVGRHIRAVYADDPDTALTLALTTVSHLTGLALEWAKTEKACARLFMFVEGEDAL